MLVQRRQNYFKNVQDKSISLFFSGQAPQKTGDQNYDFSVNRNFYYLSGITQANSVLLLVKGEKETAHLFIEGYDPIKALWEDKILTFEEASKVSLIPVNQIHDIKTLEGFILNILSTSRRAIYGSLDKVYLDLEKQSITQTNTKAQNYANKLQVDYPFLSILTNQLVLAELRMVKDQKEIEQISEAIRINKIALERVLSKLKTCEHEYEAEAEFNYVLNKHHKETSFKTIAASGKHATVLHYGANEAKLSKNDLILFDLGVLNEGYASDISRTYPVGGTFTKRQKEVYEVVLKANKETIKWLKPGITMQEFNAYGKKILTEGAKAIGLIKEDSEIDQYYYHSLGHYLGLDVHDVGNYTKPIPAGSVITIEPGLYIASEGIGIRIEDDVLVTENGNINLSEAIIKEVKDIESFMKK